MALLLFGGRVLASRLSLFQPCAAPLSPSSSFSSSSALLSGARHRPAAPTLRAGSLSELVALNSLRDIDGARKVARRTGRGQGSSKGKLGGYGMKGQGQMSHRKGPGFEGGQTPLFRRVKKTGFSNARHARQPLAVNLSQLQALIDRGRLDADQPITIKSLYEAGLFARIPHHGVKILSDGAAWFQAKLDLYVTAASENAKKAVERNGGRLTTVYYNRQGLRRFCLGEGPDYPGAPPPVFAHAPPEIASRFDLPRAPAAYPVESPDQIVSATALFKRNRHTFPVIEKWGYPENSRLI